ncbi:hypothetical protein KR093_008185 [Drosophila rubida]|uniref:Protein TsetseEP domain-containing protein n=1 Tax=Drosophila rubida TaxID=30044 RepID=A0AAD4JTX9_9MUSC|nr:hypothetical protein KR093_008185 [Drosophila rubida]
MLFKALSVLLVIGTAMALTPSEVRINTDRLLLDLMMMPRNRDATNEANCWANYTPIMKEIIDVFEAESKECIENFNGNKTVIAQSYDQERANITEIAKTSCTTLQLCDGEIDQIDAFKCFGATGSDQSQKLSKMSSRSSAAAISLQEELSRIISVKGLCDENAAAKYRSDNSNAFEDLKNCLDGKTI